MKYFSNKNLDDKIKKGGGGGGETYTADEDTLHLGDGNEFSINDSWKGKINLGVTAYGKIYFQPNANLSSLVEPIAAFDYLGSKKGLIFEPVAESEVEDSPAHLMLRNFGTTETPNYALYTPYAIISKGDQIIGSGTPGGGGGGDSKYLNDLLDVTITNPSNGQALVYQNGEWVNGAAQSGSVTSVGLSMPTGFSVSGSPVTSSGTLAVSFSNGYSLPTTEKQTNWDTAYGWGNHANAGYLLASTAQSTYLTQTLASTLYHPKGGDTASNTFKIGGATFTWHPESSAGAGDAYLELDSALLTLGDQIVGSGTPGQGGGGAGYLYELHDVADSLATPTSGMVLQYNGSEWVGVQASTIGGVTSVVGQTGAITAAQISAALNLGAAATYGIGSVASGNTGLVTGGSVYSAINSALSSVLKFVGVTTTEITDGSTTNPVIINGSSYTAVTGNVVLYGAKEYLWTGLAWEEMGDEASWALKTIEITAGDGLEGGGNLTTNRIISLSDATIASLALADSAYQKPAGGIPNTDLANSWVKVGTTQINLGGQQTSLAGLVNVTMSGKLTIGSAEIEWVAGTGGAPGYLKINSALLTDGDQIVGGGTPGGGGGGGAQYLTDLLDVYPSTKPSAQKILVFDPNQNDKNGNSGAWVYADMPTGSVTSVVGQTGDVTAAQIATALTSAGYKLTDTTYTAGTGLTISSSNVIGIASGYKLPTTTEWGNKADASSLGNYVAKAGDTMTGALTFSQGSSTRRNGIIGTYDANRAAAIWSMGDSYQIAADGMTMGNLYGACYAYYGSGYTYGAGKSGGHSFVWCQNGSPTSALGNNVWTSGGFIKNGGTSSQFLKADGSVDSTAYLPLAGGELNGSNGYPLTIKTSSSDNILRFYAAGSQVAAFAWQSGTYGAYMQNIAVSGSPYVNIASDGVFKYNNTNPFLHSGNYSSYALPLSAGSGKPLTGALYIAAGLGISESSGGNGMLVYHPTGWTGVTSSQWGVGAADCQGVIRSSAANLVHYRGGTSYAIYDEYNLTKSVLTGLLDASGGYYLPLAGGAMTGAGSITFTGDYTTVPVIRNYTSNTTSGWARGLVALWVDGSGKFSIGAYGSYTAGGSSNGINYAYIGCNSYDGVNLRITSSTLTWGTNNILHAGNYASYTPILNSASTHATSSSVIYAPTSVGVAGQILISLGSGAPAWTTVARGASNTPIYINSSGVLTEGVGCLPLSAGSSYPLTGDLYLTAGKGIEATGGAGLLVYHPSTTWTGISNTQWGVGAIDSQGVIRSSDTNLIHYRNSSNYTIWDASNSNKSDVAWNTSTLYASSTVVAGAGGEGIYMSPTGINWHNSSNVWTKSIVSFTSDGAVGIGTASPGYKLDVNGSVGCSTLTASDSVQFPALVSGDDPSIIRNNSNFGFQIMSGQSLPIFIGFRANTTPAIGVNTAGNVGIGTNSPTQKLDVRGNIVSTGDQIINNDTATIALNSVSGASSSTYRASIVNRYNWSAPLDFYGGQTGINFMGFRNGSGFYLMPAGGTVNVGTSIASASLMVYGSITSTGDQVISSDINLKTNLKDVTYGVEDIAKTRAVTFDWKDGRGHSAGSIAQDWKPLIPELVHGEEGNMTLAYGQIALVNTIILAKHETEQDKEIKKLKARVRDLEKQLKLRS